MHIQTYVYKKIFVKKSIPLIQFRPIDILKKKRISEMKGGLFFKKIEWVILLKLYE